MAKQKRTYTVEFKQEALRLLATSGKGLSPAPCRERFDSRQVENGWHEPVNEVD